MITVSPDSNEIYNSGIKLFNPQPQDQENLPLLVYLPGMDGTGELFHQQIADLQPYFDLRCLSIPSHNKFNWEQLTQATITCLEKELDNNHHSAVYLCGESFGGCLAMKVALAKPKVIKKLVLVNCASSFNQQPILSLGITLTRLLPDWLHRNSTVGLLPFLAELNRLSYSDRRALLAAMKSLPQEIISWRLALLRDFAVDPQQCSQFQPTTLIISSKCDRLLPSEQEAIKLAALFPNSIQEILPNSGHACLLETDIKLMAIMAQHQLIKS